MIIGEIIGKSTESENKLLKLILMFVVSSINT